jgi:hypothetical protein
LTGDTWKYGCSLKNRTVQQFDDGETKINTNTWPKVGRAVAALMKLENYTGGRGELEYNLDDVVQEYILIYRTARRQ